MSSFDESNRQPVHYWQVLRNHWGVILLSLILSVLTSFVTITLMKKVYSSETKFIINPDQLLIDSKTTSGGIKESRNRTFFANELIALKSPEVLKVVDGKTEDGTPLRRYTSDLGDDYQTALERFARKIRVEVDEIGTSVVLLSVSDTDKVMAKELADAIRDGYLAHRLEERQGSRNSVYEKLSADFAKAKVRQEDLFRELQQSSRDSGLPYTADSMIEIKNEAKENFEIKKSQDLNQAEKIKQYQFEAENVIKKTDKQLVSHLSTGSPIIRREDIVEMDQEIKSKRIERSALLIEGLGEKHPLIKQIDKFIEEKQRELAAALVTVREEIRERLQLEKIKKSNIEESIETLKEEFSEYNKQFTAHERLVEEYWKAKYDAEILREDTSRTRNQAGYLNNPIKILSRASLPGDPVRPNISMIMGVGTVAGLILGFAIAFLTELLDTSVKTMEDVERQLGIDVLAVVPKGVGLLNQLQGNTPDAEAYRILRTNIEFARKSPKDNVITVVSGGAGEGKSTTLMNLAYVCAQGGYTTLVIDADLRRPRIHSYLGLGNKVGLSNYLTSDATLNETVSKTEIENLFFIASGSLPEDASSILKSSRMSDLIAEVKNRFDVVLIDSPPILGVSDAAVISSEADHTIIVIQHRKLPVKQLQRVKQAVQSVGGEIIGVVLNNVDLGSDTEYQYYTNYYSYYSPSAIEKSRAEVRLKKGVGDVQETTDEPY